MLQFKYILVFMKENLELKAHYALSLIRMIQGNMFESVLKNSPLKWENNNYIELLSFLKMCVPMCKRLRVDR